MRMAVLALAVMVSPAMAAEPDYLGQLNRWLWPHAPRTERIVIEPLPDIPPTPQNAQVPRSEAPPKARKPSARAAPERAKPAAKPQPAPISCSDARQGVGMPCFMIRANAYQYERLSVAEKAKVNSCLTAAERAAIAACFR